MSKPLENDSIPTRLSLLLRLKDWGDQASWNVFFEKYSRLICKVALKAGLTHTEAEEVVQETLLSVARNIGEFRYDPAVCSFRTWLLQATHWRINDQLQRRQKNTHCGDADGREAGRAERLDQVPDPAGSDLEKVWQQEWEKNLVEVALERVKRKVSPRHFQIFDLYAVKEWPVSEVASALGISAARVYLVKHRVAARFKKELSLMETSMNGEPGGVRTSPACPNGMRDVKTGQSKGSTSP